MNLKPRDGYVIVRECLPKLKAKSGIILASSTKELVKRCRRGEIIAKGKDKTLSKGKAAKMNVEVGDTVIFGKFNGEHLGNIMQYDGEENIVILARNELLAKV